MNEAKFTPETIEEKMYETIKLLALALIEVVKVFPPGPERDELAEIGRNGGRVMIDYEEYRKARGES